MKQHSEKSSGHWTGDPREPDLYPRFSPHVRSGVRLEGFWGLNGQGAMSASGGLAAPAPCNLHRLLSTLVASSTLRSTDVFWPVLPP